MRWDFPTENPRVITMFGARAEILRISCAALILAQTLCLIKRLPEFKTKYTL